jgi:hypothetical protein
MEDEFLFQHKLQFKTLSNLIEIPHHINYRPIHEKFEWILIKITRTFMPFSSVRSFSGPSINFRMKTKIVFLHLTKQEDIEGLPEYLLERASNQAKSHNLDGWILFILNPASSLL